VPKKLNKLMTKTRISQKIGMNEKRMNDSDMNMRYNNEAWSISEI